MSPTFSRATTRLTTIAAAVVLSLLAALTVPAPAAAVPEPAAADTLLERACPADTVQRYVFTDVPASHRHAVAIDCASWWGIVSGRSGQRFAPGDAVTRGQAASMLARIVLRAEVAVEPVAHPGFVDTAHSVHADNILRLASLGVITGAGDATFAPDAPITRAQMATMLVRLHERVFAHDFHRDGGATSGPFTDTAGNVHAGAIDTLAASGIASGVSATRFDPFGHVTRAQMATFTARSVGLQVRAGALSHPPAPEGFMASLGRVLSLAVQQRVVPAGLNPSLRTAGDELPVIYDDGCVSTETTSPACIYGDVDATRSIVLLGDSHAAHWFPPVNDLARERGWQLTVLTKGGCPMLEIAIWRDGRPGGACNQWRDHALDRIAALQPDRIILANATTYDAYTDDGDPRPGEQRTNLIDGQAAITATLRTLTPDTHLTIMGASPRLDSPAPECLARNLDDTRPCTPTRDQVVDTQLINGQHTQATIDQADFINTTDLLCTDTTCPLIIGDLLVYWDTHHLTTPTSHWLRPALHHTIPH